jgi:hypothetical protein
MTNVLEISACKFALDKIALFVNSQIVCCMKIYFQFNGFLFYSKFFLRIRDMRIYFQFMRFYFKFIYGFKNQFS